MRNYTTLFTDTEVESIIKELDDVFQTEDIEQMGQKFLTNLKSMQKELKVLVKDLKTLNSLQDVQNQKKQIETKLKNEGHDKEITSAKMKTALSPLELKKSDMDKFESIQQGTSATYGAINKIISTKRAQIYGKAYVYVMKIREILTDQKVDYHIYAKTDGGETILVELDDYEVLYAMKENDNKIGMACYTALNVINEAKINNNKQLREKQSGLNAQAKRGFDLFKQAIDKKVLVETKVEDENGKMKTMYQVAYNGNKKWYKDKNLSNEKAKFNKGHFFEAFDIITSKMIQNQTFGKIKYNNVINNLEHDNVDAWAGGDNAEDFYLQHSVKAIIGQSSATIKSYQSVQNILNILINLIDGITTKGFSKEEIKKQLKKNFFDKNKYTALGKTAKAMNNDVDKAVNRMLEIFKPQQVDNSKKI